MPFRFMRGPHRAASVKKFREFRVAFAVFSLALLFGAFAGALMWSGVSLTPFGRSVFDALTQRLSTDESTSFFMRASCVFRRPAAFLLAFFFFGVTLYAPLVSFGLCAFFGVCGGMTLGLCSGISGSGVFSALFGTEAAFFLVCGLCMCAYAAFCSCVSLKQSSLIPEGEDRLFGGSLFCGNFFGSVNLRFCFMYFGIFFLFALLVFLLACLRSLVPIQ